MGDVKILALQQIFRFFLISLNVKHDTRPNKLLHIRLNYNIFFPGEIF